ncbi:hypothetical protein GWI33_006963 [Rhynchophorus ferrugineus]|uniref:Uncharacterized protein n=1 Tax=Rhynchophorus ferrugineus TaxID=354439 RepID=A0A834IKZ0_RHYFE|nr:hypothetical protein GWI33_006963 [Rhynchophorus ferrugineus]
MFILRCFGTWRHDGFGTIIVCSSATYLTSHECNLAPIGPDSGPSRATTNGGPPGSYPRRTAAPCGCQRAPSGGEPSRLALALVQANEDAVQLIMCGAMRLY